MTTYRIVRFYENPELNRRIIKGGLTLEQAKAWCNDPETSSMSARSPRGCAGDEDEIAAWHEDQKHWFDGFEEEK